jgi:hypothetical protein
MLGFSCGGELEGRDGAVCSPGIAQSLAAAEGRPFVRPSVELVTALKTANPSSACDDAGRDRDSAIGAKRAYRRSVVANTLTADRIIDAIRRTVLPSPLGP